VKRSLLILVAVLVSCAPPLPPKVTVDDARKVVAAYIGNHAWDITFDTPHDAVRDGIRYYSVTLGGTGEGDPKGFFVSSQTGDIYDSEFRLEQSASELQPSGPAEMTSGTLPADYTGSFAIGKDPMAGEIQIDGQEFALSDEGQSLKATVGPVAAKDGEVTFTVTGRLHDGQDENSKEYEGSWDVTLSSGEDGLTLTRITGPGHVDENFSGKVFQKE
jgi:hypothetical protein